jgi:hypothetical protein
VVHDALDFLSRARAGILIGRAQPGTQQELPSKDRERQLTVLAIVAVKAALFLVAMHRIIRGVQVKHQRSRGLSLGLQKHLEEHAVYRLRIDQDLLVSLLFRRGVWQSWLQTVARAFTRQGIPVVAEPPALLSSRVWLADSYPQQGVTAALVVIVEVFIAQRQGIDTLFDQFFHGRLDPGGSPLIGKASSKATEDAGMAFDLT